MKNRQLFERRKRLFAKMHKLDKHKESEDRQELQYLESEQQFIDKLLHQLELQRNRLVIESIQIQALIRQKNETEEMEAKNATNKSKIQSQSKEIRTKKSNKSTELEFKPNELDFSVNMRFKGMDMSSIESEVEEEEDDE